MGKIKGTEKFENTQKFYDSLSARELLNLKESSEFRLGAIKRVLSMIDQALGRKKEKIRF